MSIHPVDLLAHLDHLAWEATPVDDPFIDWYFTMMHQAEDWWAMTTYGTPFDWGSEA